MNHIKLCSVKRFALIAAATFVAILSAPPAYGHGTMVNPASRAYHCYQDNPESPRSAVCKAVVAAGGTQPLYDWNEVNIGDAAGRHRELIPDGKLCSAGRDKYRGLDLARSDWPTTTLPANGDFTFGYRGTAPHRGSFELYVTKDGFDPARPLAWSDLESTPFLRVKDPQLVNGVYQLSGRLPGKQGRHLIYAIWQRSDSPEAFYACSDVQFQMGTQPAAPPSNTQPTSSPPPPPAEHSHAPAAPAATTPPAAPAAGDRLPTTGTGASWRFGTMGGILLTGGIALAWFARHRAVWRVRSNARRVAPEGDGHS